MTLVHTYDGSDLTNRVQLREEEKSAFSARADLGEPDRVRVVVDDPDGTLDFLGHRTWSMRETTALSGNQVLWRGFVGEQAIGRGGLDGTIFPTGTGRRWDLELIEINSFAERRLLRPETSTCKRLRETVSTRIAWLLTTPGFTGRIVDGGHIEASSAEVDERDYTDAPGSEVLQDCANASGFNYFLRYREDEEDAELFFRNDETNPDDVSSLRISNDPDDLDDDTVAPLDGYRLVRSPTRWVSGIAVPFKEGSVYRTSVGNEAAIGDAVDAVAPMVNTTDIALAEAHGDRLLFQQSAQEEKVSDLAVQIPASQVNAILAGQLLEAKFVHLPGWDDFRLARAVRRAVRRPPNLSQDRYRVELEIRPQRTRVFALAQLQAPQSSQYAPNTVFPVHWDHDGDDTQAGCSPVPLTGPIAYQGASGERTGLIMGGGGVVDIHCRGTHQGANLGPPIPVLALVYLNGVEIGRDSDTIADPAFGWTWDITLTGVHVRAGDVISCAYGTGAPSIFVIPGGTGDCANELRVTGYLAA